MRTDKKVLQWNNSAAGLLYMCHCVSKFKIGHLFLITVLIKFCVAIWILRLEIASLIAAANSVLYTHPFTQVLTEKKQC